MKEIEIQALQEIDILSNNKFDIQFMYASIKDDWDEMSAEAFVLGVLNSKDVLIAMWGEGEIEITKCIACEYNYGDKSYEIAWQYHYNQQAGFTVSERLEYWRENKK